MCNTGQNCDYNVTQNRSVNKMRSKERKRCEDINYYKPVDFVKNPIFIIR